MLQVLENFDGALLLAIQQLHRPWLDGLLCVYTKMGDAGLVWIALSLLLLCRKSTRRAGCMALLALGLGFLFTNVALKNLVARPRPWLELEGLLPLVFEGDPNSIPSGHTTSAFAAGVSWFFCAKNRWLKVSSLFAAAAMGFSRLYVGVHYPLDVLAGVLVGTLAAVLARAILRKAQKRRKAG